jgi:Lon protease-like protein
VAGIIHQLARGQDGTLRLIVQGLERVRIAEYTSTDPYLVARVEAAPLAEDNDVESQALRRAVVDLFRSIAAIMPELPKGAAAPAPPTAPIVSDTTPMPRAASPMKPTASHMNTPTTRTQVLVRRSRSTTVVLTMWPSPAIAVSMPATMLALGGE